MMRDDESVHEYAKRKRAEDDAFAVAALIAAFFALSGVIALALLLRPAV